MSGYIHTIGFKVLIDSEVVDFTFRIPRGTLLIQVLDELETTLKIHPRVIATINNSGEIILIENHYSPIDYLIQLHGTEFYAGGSSVVTFNHDVYVVDLEVPEAIPFASAFRTACKSFSVGPMEIAIERQDGQIMDHEVFSMPTAFVLNSWGNFYRFVDKDLGDVLTEPPKSPDFIGLDSEDVSDDKEEMVYPPKLDGSDIIDIVDIANKLMAATPTDESEIDSMTDNFVESSFSDQQEEEQKDEEFLTSPVKTETETDAKRYPWKRESTQEEEVEEEEDEDEAPIEQTIESLLEEVLIVDDSEEEGFTPEKLPSVEAPVDQPPTPFANLFPDEEQEEDEEEITTEDDLVVFAQDYEEDEKEEIEEEEEDLFDYLEDESELTDVEDPFEDEDVEEDEESLVPVHTLDDEEEVQVLESQEEIPVLEESISDFPEVEEAEMIEPLSEFDQTVEEDEEEQITVIEQEVESEETPFVSATDAVVEEIEEVIEESVIEEPILKPTADAFELPLNERLEQRKKELETIEAALKAEASKKETIQQRSVSIEYYEKMRTQKIAPLIVRIPPVNGNNSNENRENDLTVMPIFPGCIVTPREEIIDLNDKNLQTVDFSITPIIARGNIAGKVSLYYKKRNVLNANIDSKIRNHLGAKITGILAILIGIFLLLPLFSVDVNTGLSVGFNTAFGTTISSSIFLYIEIALAVVFLILTVILLFVNKPVKKDFTRKFYPIAPNHDD